MSIKTSIIGLIIVFIVSFSLTIYFNSTTSNSPNPPEKVNIGGIKTGMYFYQVNEKLNIKFHSRDERGCTKYKEKGKDVYYIFNDDNRKFIGKSSVKNISELKDTVEKCKENFGTAVVKKGIWFFSNEGSDLGVKIIDDVKTNDKFILWKGSISLWNEYSTYGHVDFPTK